jgi:tetratricopeptide (TPR) repeat protein
MRPATPPREHVPVFRRSGKRVWFPQRSAQGSVLEWRPVGLLRSFQVAFVTGPMKMIAVAIHLLRSRRPPVGVDVGNSPRNAAAGEVRDDEGIKAVRARLPTTLRDDGAMSRDREGGQVRRSRAIKRPQVGPGPLGELKNLLYELYTASEAPTLDEIAAEISDLASDDRLRGAPSRDTVGRILGTPELPAQQADAIAVAVVLARRAAWDQDDIEARIRTLWIQARLNPGKPLGLPIRQLDPFALEVHRAIELAPAMGGSDLPALPAYVERPHDQQLRAAVKRVAKGESKLVMLVGGSYSGKTRACWEAVQALPDGWRLWHPFDPGRPEATLAALDRVGPRTVLWLNESQYYLLTPELGERLAASLRTLLQDPDRSPVLVLGTIWQEYWDTLTVAPRPGEADPHAQARTLLTATSIGVPDVFTDADLDALHAMADRDPRLAQAAERAEQRQITQYLAGAPVQMERYRTAFPAAKALIEAAMDARRLGHGPALPLSLLEAAAPGYLTDQQWELAGDDWLERALAYTTAPLRGARGPLTRIRPRPGSPARELHYRLADYLEQHARTARLTTKAPAALWDAFIDHAAREDLGVLSFAAHARRLNRYAFHIAVAAAYTGDGEDLRTVHDVLHTTGRPEEALPWLQLAADAGDQPARNWLPGVLVEAGRTDQAIAWLQEQVDAGGDTFQMRRAVDLMVEAGRSAEAITWLQARATDGDTNAEELATSTLMAAGRTQEALTLSQNAADTRAQRLAARLLLEAGRIDEALTRYRLIAEAGDPSVWRDAASPLLKAGRIDEAITWLQSHADASDPNDLRLTAEVLQKVGRDDEALTWYERAIGAGDPSCEGVADLLIGAGRIEEALACYERAAHAGHTYAQVLAVELLLKQGRTDEAITRSQCAIDAGNPWFPQQGFELLSEFGRVDEALTRFRPAADAGDPTAVTWVVGLLLQENRVNEAITCLQDCASTRDLRALRLSGHLLSEVTQSEGVVIYSSDSEELGGLQLMANLLSRMGRDDEALACYERVADAGDLDALRLAANLLSRMGRDGEALACYERVADAGSWCEEMAVLLKKVGRPEEAERLLLYGREPDGTIARHWEAEPPASHR